MLLLAGVTLNAFFSALILFVQYLSDFAQTYRALRWLMGDLDVASYAPIVSALPLVVVAFAGVRLARAAAESAERRRRSARPPAASKSSACSACAFFAASLATGAAVSVGGPIGFVGIIVPHLVRLLVGADHRLVLPASIFFGAAFLVGCDVVARTHLAPIELPVGIITAVIGGPFFLWLLVKSDMKGPRVRGSKGPRVLGSARVRPGQTRVRPLVALVWALMAFVTLATPCPPQDPRTLDLRTLGPSGPVRPSRIISFVPAVTEMLFAIGAGDQVVGVSSYDIFPPEAKTTSVDGRAVRPRRRAHSCGEVRPRHRLRVADGAHVASGSGRRCRCSDTSTRDSPTSRQPSERSAIASAAAHAARELSVAIERDLDAIRRSVAGKPRPKTALLFGREPGALRNIYASGGTGFMHDMLELAGGIDAFADVKRQNLQATTEILLARAPEVIIEVHPAEGWTPERIVIERAVWKGLPSLPAVRTGRIHILTDDRLIVPGPRVAEGARLLASVLHAPGR